MRSPGSGPAQTDPGSVRGGKGLSKAVIGYRRDKVQSINRGAVGSG
ncbi:MAG: hypothetical protein Kow00105_09760 [Phycisphaeraceae bacterium]